MSYSLYDKDMKPRCSYCGKYISYDDLIGGCAMWSMKYPDSDISVETWEGKCRECLFGKKYILTKDM